MSYTSIFICGNSVVFCFVKFIYLDLWLYLILRTNLIRLFHCSSHPFATSSIYTGTRGLGLGPKDLDSDTKDSDSDWVDSTPALSFKLGQKFFLTL